MIFAGVGAIWAAIVILALCMAKMSSLGEEIFIEEEDEFIENWDWPILYDEPPQTP